MARIFKDHSPPQRKTERSGRQGPPAFCQYAHKPNDFRSRGLTGKRVRGFQFEDVVPLANHYLGLKRQSLCQLCTQSGLTNPIPHHKSSGGANIHKIEIAQLIREEARPKGPVAPDIDSPQEDDQRHDTLIFNQQSWHEADFRSQEAYLSTTGELRQPDFPV